MSTDAQDIYSDTLFVAMTRPATKWGVPVTAIVLEAGTAVIVFLATKNPLYLLAVFPIHGIVRLMTADNPWIFAEIWSWVITFMRCINRAFWGAASFSPLPTKKWQK